MKVNLLNYADHNFRTSQRQNSRTGLSVGGFGRVLSYGPKDIDRNFYAKNKAILDVPRGNGLWLWKPYFIHRTLQELPNGDWLFYCDAGSYFIHSISPLIELAEATGSDILTFADEHPERKFSKRDAFVLLNADQSEITDTPQRLGGFSLWRKSETSLAFAEEYLKYCQDTRIMTDGGSVLGQPDYPEFKANRNDQTVLSILAKKHGLPAYRDPSQWGNDRAEAYPNSPYPQIIELTRQRNVPLKTRIKRWILRR